MARGIIIIGPAGAGKTTLGELVAGALSYPYFDIDDYLWRWDTPQPYTQMHSREEKISGLKEAIAPYEHFVMAGSMSSFHEEFDDLFDMMVLLYTDVEIRVERINRRAVERFGSRVLEGGDMYENHLRFVQDNREYEAGEAPYFDEQKAWMASLSCKKLVLDGAEPLADNVKRIVEAYHTEEK